MPGSTRLVPITAAMWRAGSPRRPGSRATGMACVAALALSGCTAPSSRMPPSSAEFAALEAFLRPSLAHHKEPVIRYLLMGQVYYLAPATCCDRHDALFDAGGAFVCAPSGGLSVLGDGRCSAGLRQELGKAKGEQITNPFLSP